MRCAFRKTGFLQLAMVLGAMVFFPTEVMSGSESRAFFAGKIYGERPALCQAAGTGCGKIAADTWCKIAGYEASMSYRTVYQKAASRRDLLVKSGDLCARDTCDGFHVVKCWRDFQNDLASVD